MNLRPKERVRTIEEYLESQYDQYGEFVDVGQIQPRDDGHDRMDEDVELEPLHVEEA